MSINETKGRLRKQALFNRNSLPEEFRRQASKEICRRLLEMQEIRDAGIIMCYNSIRSEVYSGEIVEKLKALGKKICFPRCEKGGIMHACCPDDENSWTKSAMGILEPDTEKSELIPPEKIDVVICPIVAFDSGKRRMGYGGGYYDRYLPRCCRALRIAVAFEGQRMDALPVEEYDQPMDIIITEEKIYR